MLIINILDTSTTGLNYFYMKSLAPRGDEASMLPAWREDAFVDNQLGECSEGASESDGYLYLDYFLFSSPYPVNTFLLTEWLTDNLRIAMNVNEYIASTTTTYEHLYGVYQCFG